MPDEVKKATKITKKRPVSKVRLYKSLIDFLEDSNIDGGAPIDEVLIQLGDAIRDEAVAKA